MSKSKNLQERSLESQKRLEELGLKLRRNANPSEVLALLVQHYKALAYECTIGSYNVRLKGYYEDIAELLADTGEQLKDIERDAWFLQLFTLG